MRYSIDSNILFYAVDNNELGKQSIAESILQQAVAFDVLLSGQVLSEFLNVVRRRRRDRIGELIDLAANWSLLFPVLPTLPHHVFRGAQIAERYGLHIGTASFSAS